MSIPNPTAGLPLRGAVDLAAVAAAREAQAKAEARLAAGPPVGAGGSVLDVTEASFQADVLDQSFVVPVVVDLWAEWCQPCKTLSPILESLAAEYGGRFVLAKVDTDANPRISQAFQVQSIPSVYAVLKGQPIPLFVGAYPEPQVRQFIDELLKVAEANGVAGTLGPPGEPSAPGGEAEEVGDPRFDAAFEAVEAGDWDAAEAAYRVVLDTAPTDPDATLGLAQVALLRRTDGVQPADAFAAASVEPDSVAAQTLAADVELLAGEVDQAFTRLVELVRRSAGDERAAARDHLVGLFTLVGDADPRVGKARTALANALF